jgi:predicted lipoprotein with Yx(FWY)xxD motif
MTGTNAHGRWIAARCALGLLALSACTTASAAPPSTTPPGITLVEVMRDLPISQPLLLWVRPGDADGRTLFSYDKDRRGRATCVDACAAEFPPLLAPRGAKAVGDWSLVRRPEGSRQWAYQSRPLYTWSKEEVPGEVATNVGLTETAEAKFAENAVEAGSLMPPEGWQVVRFAPATSMKLPDGVDARLVMPLQAVALTDPDGHTLYEFSGDASRDEHACAAYRTCRAGWIPLAASQLARSVGAFSVVTRADGSPQWAHQGRPLYTYSGDKLPGDAHGVGVHEKWKPAIVTQSFRPERVDVVTLAAYGDALTLDGMTLYGGYAFDKRWGGRNLRDTFTNQYWRGKKLGARACDDADCAQLWKPFLAPADAMPAAFWEPIARPDGTKQWAYKGHALYTYAGDKAPGEHYGQATYDFEEVHGRGVNFQRASFLETISKAPGGVGIYWNVAKP